MYALDLRHKGCGQQLVLRQILEGAEYEREGGAQLVGHVGIEPHALGIQVLFLLAALALHVEIAALNLILAVQLEALLVRAEHIPHNQGHSYYI